MMDARNWSASGSDRAGRRLVFFNRFEGSRGSTGVTTIDVRNRRLQVSEKNKYE